MPDPATGTTISAIYVKAKIMGFKPKHIESYGVTTGKHLRTIGRALPDKHTIKIYNAFNRKAAAILVQLRTDKSRLNTYLQMIKSRYRQMRMWGPRESTPLPVCVPEIERGRTSHESSTQKQILGSLVHTWMIPDI